MPNYYGDVYVIAKMRLRVDANVRKLPVTKEAMLKLLREYKYNDITDDELLEVISVEQVDESSG